MDFFIGLLLTLIITYYSFQPKLKVFPDTYFNPEDPMSATFIFENDGSLSIYNVDYQFFVRKIILFNNSSIQNIFMKTAELPVRELSPSQAFSDFVVFPFHTSDSQSNSSIKEADIDVELSYRPRFFFRKTTITRRFITKVDSDGNLKWINAKPLNDIPPKEKRAVFIYTGLRKY